MFGHVSTVFEHITVGHGQFFKFGDLPAGEGPFDFANRCRTESAAEIGFVDVRVLAAFLEHPDHPGNRIAHQRFGARQVVAFDDFVDDPVVDLVLGFMAPAMFDVFAHFLIEIGQVLESKVFGEFIIHRGEDDLLDFANGHGEMLGVGFFLILFADVADVQIPRVAGPRADQAVDEVLTHVLRRQRDAAVLIFLADNGDAAGIQHLDVAGDFVAGFDFLGFLERRVMLPHLADGGLDLVVGHRVHRLFNDQPAIRGDRIIRHGFDNDVERDGFTAFVVQIFDLAHVDGVGIRMIDGLAVIFLDDGLDGFGLDLAFEF